MKNALVEVVNKTEERTKAQLQKAIDRKKQRLRILSAKYEMLKVELEVIKHEYDVRIGNLFIKDNKLDIEIIRFKDILLLMQQKEMTYEEAVLENEMKFYNTGEDFTFDEAFITGEEVELNGAYEPKEETDTNYRVLWKKLILKFHPDLVSSPEEKAKREEIMKKINNAYREKNYKALSAYDLELAIEEVVATTIETLENALVYTENKIIQVESLYEDLKQSEWYRWKKNMIKAKKKNEDVFKGLEKMLLDDIIKKIAILQELKNKVGVK